MSICLEFCYDDNFIYKCKPNKFGYSFLVLSGWKMLPLIILESFSKIISKIYYSLLIGYYPFAFIQKKK